MSEVLIREAKIRPLDAENPWPGLESFQEQDQEFFHGREAEADELSRLIRRERVTLLFGRSGLGKTSLLQAGLFPWCRAKNILPVYIRLDFAARAPRLREQILDHIESQAESSNVEPPPTRDSDMTLWEYFHREDSDFWNERNRPVIPFLVFDQFEEIFTVGKKRGPETEAIVTELVDLAEGRAPAEVKARLDAAPEQARVFSFGRHPYKILFSLREDYLPELEALQGRIRVIAHNRLRLCQMDGEAALSVANQAEELLSDEVTLRIIRFVAASDDVAADVPLNELRIEPAQLSVVCRELNNRRIARGEPRITKDLLMGNRDEIVSDLYEKSLAKLGPGIRTFVEERLLTVSGHRDSVALDNALEAPGVTADALDELVDRRLLRIDDHAGRQRVELTHDLLTGVIAASRDQRRQYEAQEKAEADHRAVVAQAARKARTIEKAHQKELRSLGMWAALAASIFLVGAITFFYSARVSREAEAAKQVSGFFTELFEASNPWERTYSAIPAREILDRGAERIREELDGQPVVQARLMDAIGTGYYQLALYDEAESLLTGALAIQKGRSRSEALDLASSLDHLARVYLGKVQYQAAKPLFDRALRIREETLGPDHPEVASTLNGLANLHYYRNDFSAAEDHYLRAKEILETAHQKFPDDKDLIRDLAQSYSGLGNLYEVQGKYAEAELWHLRARTKLIDALGEDHTSVAVSDYNLANLYKVLGRTDEASRNYTAALKALEQALGKEHPAVAMVLDKLGILYYEQGYYKEQPFKEEHYKKAENLHLRALEIREEYFGSNHPDLARSHGNLAHLYGDWGQSDRAESYYIKACKVFEGSLGGDHTEVARCNRNFGFFRSEQGRFKEADELLRRALEIYKNKFGEDHIEVAYTLEDLAWLDSRQRNFEQAASGFKRALAILEKTFGKNDPNLATTLHNLGDTYRELGDQTHDDDQNYYRKAEDHFLRALEILESNPGQEDLRRDTLKNYAATLRSMNRDAEAIAVEE